MLNSEVLKMSIDELKKDIVENIGDYVTTEAKDALVSYTDNTVIPSIREVADVYINALKESAVEESGWCKVRDLVVLPCIISSGVWLAGILVKKVSNNG